MPNETDHGFRFILGGAWSSPTAHDVMVNRTEVVKEVLSWLDQYLGAVAH